MVMCTAKLIRAGKNALKKDGSPKKPSRGRRRIGLSKLRKVSLVNRTEAGLSRLRRASPGRRSNPKGLSPTQVDLRRISSWIAATTLARGVTNGRAATIKAVGEAAAVAVGVAVGAAAVNGKKENEL
jgi:hypothetical protein